MPDVGEDKIVGPERIPQLRVAWGGEGRFAPLWGGRS